MLHTSNPIIKHKAGLLNLAEELGNVSKACKVMGVSRDTFYRYQELVETGGIDALINQSRRTPNEIETAHPGYLGSQDTFYVGNLKGVGRIYQQTFVDTYSKVAFAKLYTTKTPITAADMLNDKVLPFFEAHELPMLRILTDRGTEYCGRVEQHDYQLYLAINDIDHTKTKAMSPQTNGICERFHKTILNEFYQVTFRKKLYGSMEELQKDLDEWMDYYNNHRTHQGKMCCGRTPIETLEDGKSIWAEKNLAQI
ncbi:helix-turn-helix domain-containing protein [Vibrio parahaemolyticus]|uniref:helix-turn-helix domain-containing protein n=1 Tax=Vibrio parahaemolyticus TaxID=670 RepID=UPI00186A54A7|nr:helix-turn-helix domain-containing protein [Vibrio parahaemolyticus]EKB1965889.1 transposase [Vibrio parahaemolyticus]ELA8093533.1 transposase [Vibrio parahaemolyticus]MBE4111379.1 transposase [Vibrio parahaemolyticus]MBE4407787.1 transposase [Vibrio parahaemolyticus]MCG7792056.1 helix-turn-helix domain-containing protein [Vibrio parahaemolyticus]